MTLSQIVVATLLASSAAAPTVTLIAPKGEAQLEEMSYEMLMGTDPKERPEIFCSLAVHNQAMVMSTHLRRWRDANLARLSPLQQDLIAEWLDLLTPMFYVRPRSDDLVRRHDDLQQRTDALFSEADLDQAFTLQGRYLPPTLR